MDKHPTKSHDEVLAMKVRDAAEQLCSALNEAGMAGLALRDISLRPTHFASNGRTGEYRCDISIQRRIEL